MKYVSALLLVVMLAWTTKAQGPPAISFTDVTSSNGITFRGPTFGAAVCDFTLDGLPDLYVGNHYGSVPSFYVSGSSGLTDIANWYFSLADRTGDKHGAAFSDFDGDGDADLFVCTGADYGTGSQPKKLFINNNGILVDAANYYGVDYPLCRSRTPLFLDLNGDMYDDLVMTAFARPDGQAPAGFFLQASGLFQDSTNAFGLPVGHSYYAQATDFTGDGVAELLVKHVALKVYQVGQPLADITATLGLPTTLTSVSDSAVADFDGDLRNDLFLAQNSTRSEFSGVGTSLLSFFVAASADEKWIKTAINTPTMHALFEGVPLSQIHIGSTGYSPTTKDFDLDSNNQSHRGMASYVPGVDTGVWIGYMKSTAIWRLVVSAPVWFGVNGTFSTSGTVTSAVGVNFDNNLQFPKDKLYLSRGSLLKDFSSSYGINIVTRARSVVAGDFDNDGWEDLYIVCSTNVGNVPNVLYRNLAGQRFTAIGSAGGVDGSAEGRGESAVTADFNGDGFLDLFVTNGEGGDPFNQGPHQLFFNDGNSNHWLDLKLVATRSPPDATGSRVFLTAGGRTQLQEQRNGMHRYSQNDRTIHFGLGSASQVTQLVVNWPSGVQQTVPVSAVDQLLVVVEQ